MPLKPMGYTADQEKKAKEEQEEESSSNLAVKSFVQVKDLPICEPIPGTGEVRCTEGEFKSHHRPS